jgi:hypothetical protein
MPGYGSGAVVLPWSSPRWQHHAAVARKVHLTNLFSFPEPPLSSAGALTGTDFCFIFAPCGYDEPEILHSSRPKVCLTGPDGEHGGNHRSCELSKTQLLSDF